MNQFRLLLRIAVMIAIVTAAWWIAQTLQTPPSTPQGLLVFSLLLGATALAWLADSVLRLPRGDR